MSKGYQSDWNIQADQSRCVEIVNDGKTMDKLLFNLLQEGRPSGDEGPVRAIILDFINKLPKKILHYTDDWGNLHVVIDKPDSSRSATYFSCHMDTVHRMPTLVTPMVTVSDKPDEEGFVFGAMKKLTYNFIDQTTGEVLKPSALKLHCRTITGVERHVICALTKIPDGITLKEGEGLFQIKYYKDEEDKAGKRWPDHLLIKTKPVPTYTASVLGADDKVGIYICCKMIEKSIPGYYVFHVCEESGSRTKDGKETGSKAISTRKDFLSKFKRAVAFDRMTRKFGARAEYDVITHQRGERCCSATFGTALAEAINAYMPPNTKYKPNDTGVFTDTANLVDGIGECTNISVGYTYHHTDRENFDLIFLEQLLIPALCRVEWETLPAVRKPGEKEARQGYGYGGFQGSRGTTYHVPYSPAHAGTPRLSVVAHTTVRERAIQSITRLLQKAGLPLRAANKGRIPAHLVTSRTPHQQVPIWFPEDGILENVPEDSMEAIIAAWLQRGHYSSAETARYVYKLLKYQTLLEMEVYQDELEKARSKLPTWERELDERDSMMY